MMKVIRYDLIGAIKAGVDIHPQKDCERLGLKTLRFQGIPIADCAMIEVEYNQNIDLPDYMELTEFQFDI